MLLQRGPTGAMVLAHDHAAPRPPHSCPFSRFARAIALRLWGSKRRAAAPARPSSSDPVNDLDHAPGLEFLAGELGSGTAASAGASGRTGRRATEP